MGHRLGTERLFHHALRLSRSRKEPRRRLLDYTSVRRRIRLRWSNSACVGFEATPFALGRQTMRAKRRRIRGGTSKAAVRSKQEMLYPRESGPRKWFIP